MAFIELGVKIEPKHVFPLASVSKQFVALSIALLVEEGKIRLDDDIRKYIPEMPDYGHKIEIQHLIHHTSGIKSFCVLSALAGEGGYYLRDRDYVLELITRQKELNNKPGDEYIYSNSGYFLMSVIVERVTNMPFHVFAKQRIFDPLGMNNTLFNHDRTQIVMNSVIGYRIDDGVLRRAVHLTSSFVGAAGMMTNPEDFAKYDRNFYRNILGKGGQKLINLLLTRGKLNNGQQIPYAFGISHGVYKGLPLLSHEGAWNGVRAGFIRFPSQNTTIFVLSNINNVNLQTLQIADIYLEDYLDPRMPSENIEFLDNVDAEFAPITTLPLPKIEQKIAATNLEKYIGLYYSDELDVTYNIKIGKEGKLEFFIRNLQVIHGYNEKTKKVVLDVYEDGSLKAELYRYRTEILVGKFVETNGVVSGMILNAERARNIFYKKVINLL